MQLKFQDECLGKCGYGWCTLEQFTHCIESSEAIVPTPEQELIWWKKWNGHINPFVGYP